MIHYSKLSLHDESDHFILHGGTYDLKLVKIPEFIAESVADLDISLKK